MCNTVNLFKRDGPSALVNNVRERSPWYQGIDELTVKAISEFA
jgi:hypothetical protein